MKNNLYSSSQQLIKLQIEMKAKDRFLKLGTLGEGTYGVVYKCKDLNTEKVVAVKKICLESEEQGIPSTALREVSILKQLNHPNIIKLEDVIHTNKKLILVFELLDHDLKKFMQQFRNQKCMEPILVKSLCYQLFKGIEACHVKKILHRDLKPQNLLVSSTKVLKLADFGLARASGIPVKSYTHEVVTLWYRPPDVLLGSQKYSTEIDIWSAGCIFAQLVNLKPLFAGQNQKDQLQKIFKVFGTPSSQTWPGCQNLPQWNNHQFDNYCAQSLSDIVPGLDEVGMDLLTKLLKMNPAERLSASQALSHPYFADLPKELLEIYENKEKM